MIVTGPNMAGKSTILRQIGLMRAAGADGRASCRRRRRTIGVVDRLFTRVGASDNLARGQSTFMVEMSETSAILHTATARSLVLLDEIGRGTCTYDGVSIAWAVSEHLHDRVGCKTVFATHYHELTQLAERAGARAQLNVAVREAGDTRRLPPPAAAGRRRPLVRHPRGAAGGVARTPWCGGRGRSWHAESEHRVVPGAPEPAPDPGQLALFAEARRIPSWRRCGTRRRHPDAARGAQPARRPAAARPAIPEDVKLPLHVLTLYRPRSRQAALLLPLVKECHPAFQQVQVSQLSRQRERAAVPQRDGRTVGRRVRAHDRLRIRDLLQLHKRDSLEQGIRSQQEQCRPFHEGRAAVEVLVVEIERGKDAPRRGADGKSTVRSHALCYEALARPALQS